MRFHLSSPRVHPRSIAIRRRPTYRGRRLEGGIMKQITLLAVVVTGSLAIGTADRRPVNGTIWAANRGAHTIRGFDAATGTLVKTIAMSPNSQPGDLAC